MAALPPTSFSPKNLTASTPFGLADQMMGWSRRVNSNRMSDEEDAAYDQSMARMLAEVEALPVTSSNAVARAKAVMAIHGCDLSEYAEGDQCTGSRLIRQIIAALAGEA